MPIIRAEQSRAHLPSQEEEDVEISQFNFTMHNRCKARNKERVEVTPELQHWRINAWRDLSEWTRPLITSRALQFCPAVSTGMKLNHSLSNVQHYLCLVGIYYLRCWFFSEPPLPSSVHFIIPSSSGKSIVCPGQLSNFLGGSPNRQLRTRASAVY